MWVWVSLILYILVGLGWLPVVWIQIKVACLYQRVDDTSAHGDETVLLSIDLDHTIATDIPSGHSQTGNFRYTLSDF